MISDSSDYDSHKEITCTVHFQRYYLVQFTRTRHFNWDKTAYYNTSYMKPPTRALIFKLISRN